MTDKEKDIEILFRTPILFTEKMLSVSGEEKLPEVFIYEKENQTKTKGSNSSRRAKRKEEKKSKS